VSAHYFETIGTPVVRGRSFKESDTASSQHVAVVSEAFVKKFLPDVEPLGQHFGKGDSSHAGDYEIVGVVRDAKYQNASRPPRAMFFVPLAQTIKYEHQDDARVESSSLYMDTIELYVAGDPNSFQQQIRQTLSAIDPNLTAPEISSFDEQIEYRTSDKNMVSRLSGVFGMVSLLLASIGLYGLTAYQVARRTSEIGIRMALGADRGNILKMVLRGAFLQVLIGLAIGIPFALLAGKMFASQLYGITSYNPVILALAIAALGICALLASIFPARRAAGIDPMRALRTE
jgi:predicted permease